MKQQISRLSIHQNAKVLALLLAVSTFTLLVPLSLLARIVMPPEAQLPWLAVLVVPLVYLVLGYGAVAFACMVYNRLFRVVGGLEFETRPATE